jgi:glycosyltransferase involved in cell wall biosynthesis
MIRVVICWPQIVGHMVPCFRSLAAKPGIELLVVAGRSGCAGASHNFHDDIAAGLNCRLLSPLEQTHATIAQVVTGFQPDIVGLPGWGRPAYRKLAFHPALRRAMFIMVMDTPLRNTWRQRLGRYRFPHYFARLAKVAVIGERAFQCARLLGFAERKISRGAMCGIDYTAFAEAYHLRCARPQGWPKRFVFTGRYVRVKAIDILLAAYAQYRESVSDPWPLSTCGSGPLESMIDASAGMGVENLGFVQPAAQTELYARHGVFVLPSRYDSWPLAIVEACAAGLPVICTEACGSAVELVRTYYNGLTVPTDDAERFASAMIWMHRHYAEIPEMGRRGMPLAAAFGAEEWARRWIEMFDELCPGRRLEAANVRVTNNQEEACLTKPVQGLHQTIT